MIVIVKCSKKSLIDTTFLYNIAHCITLQCSDKYGKLAQALIRIVNPGKYGAVDR